MDVSAVADVLTVTAGAESLGLARLLLLRRSAGLISLPDSSGAGPSPCSSAASMNPVDAVAPPPVKPDPYRTLTRALLRRSRRTRRRLRRSAGGHGVGDDGALDGVGDGPFGGGGGGGGQGWNFDGFGGQSWDDSSRQPRWGSGFAFDFIYEVIYWIALSKCVHFAFKRVARIVAATTIGDVQREKVPVRLRAMC
ncbi:hypothetical protein BT93_B0972 [Corymbia citriodora subsp. variegata]|nr:hypothetical protein BT93_B0972 [Corymbia citriodora subsp. variegata]